MTFLEKFSVWVCEPIVELLTDKKENKQIMPIKTIEQAQPLFKPTSFDEYIGQNKAKNILSNYLIGIKAYNKIFPHTLIYGSAGMGKTTLAEIIARELAVRYYYTVASNINKETDLEAIIKMVEGGIFMIDEIHGLDRNTAEKLYPLMETFSNVSPFTLIGATTEIGEIIKNRKPFYDRFKIIIELDIYTVEDLVKIASQYKWRMFPQTLFKNETYRILAENSRNTPRTLIRLLEATVYFNGDIYKVLDSFSIVKNSITIKDLKTLSYIASNEKGVGLGSIANYLDTSAENYSYNIEPFLLQNQFISRTARGRCITEKGLKLLRELT
jgi:holliday junction DNA helicase RuvB